MILHVSHQSPGFPMTLKGMHLKGRPCVMPTAAARPLPCRRDARLGRAAPLPRSPAPVPAVPTTGAWGSLTASSCANMRWYMRSRSCTGRMGSYAPCSFCKRRTQTLAHPLLVSGHGDLVPSVKQRSQALWHAGAHVLIVLSSVKLFSVYYAGRDDIDSMAVSAHTGEPAR